MICLICFTFSYPLFRRRKKRKRLKKTKERRRRNHWNIEQENWWLGVLKFEYINAVLILNVHQYRDLLRFLEIVLLNDIISTVVMETRQIVQNILIITFYITFLQRWDVVFWIFVMRYYNLMNYEWPTRTWLKIQTIKENDILKVLGSPS